MRLCLSKDEIWNHYLILYTLLKNWHGENIGPHTSCCVVDCLSFRTSIDLKGFFRLFLLVTTNLIR